MLLNKIQMFSNKILYKLLDLGEYLGVIKTRAKGQ